jgi:hypothetical protein
LSSENLLYYGDNLDILRRYIQDESADLVNVTFKKAAKAKGKTIETKQMFE